MIVVPPIALPINVEAVPLVLILVVPVTPSVPLIAELPAFNVPVVVLPATIADASVEAPAFNVPVVVLRSVVVPAV